MLALNINTRNIKFPCVCPQLPAFSQPALLPPFGFFTSYVSLLLVDWRKKTIPDGFLHQVALYRELRVLGGVLKRTVLWLQITLQLTLYDLSKNIDLLNFSPAVSSSRETEGSLSLSRVHSW